MTKSNPTHNQELLKHSNVIALSLAILTFVLVATTFWYAYSTQQIVNIMASDFEVSNRPYVSIRAMDSEKKNDVILFWYGLGNNGKTPAIIKDIEVIGYSLENDTTKLLESSKNEFILQPGEWIKNDLAKISGETLKEKIKIKLLIKYKSPSQKETPYETIYSYKYDGKGNLAIIDSDMK